MQFSRYREITTLMRYRDFLANRQPELAVAVARRALLPAKATE